MQRLTLGLVVNPFAGVGGPAGLKGSDGAEIVAQALARGVQLRAPERAQRCLAALDTHRSQLTLLTYGGFPEPFFAQSARDWKRWQRERLSRVIHEDLVSLEQVKEISQLDLLAIML